MRNMVKILREYPFFNAFDSIIEVANATTRQQDWKTKLSHDLGCHILELPTHVEEMVKNYTISHEALTKMKEANRKLKEEIKDITKVNKEESLPLHFTNPRGCKHIEGIL